MAEQVLFTERCEEAIAAGRLNELLIEQEAQLDAYTNTNIQVHVCCVYALEREREGRGLPGSEFLIFISPFVPSLTCM